MANNINDGKARLEEQIIFLKNSCKGFDKGTECEGIRVAATLRILLHDTPHSTSLLKQLQVKDKLNFIDTSIPKESFAFWELKEINNTIITQTHYCALLAKKVEGAKGINTISYTPLFNNSNFQGYCNKAPLVTFNEWWHKCIYADSNKIEISRKELVLLIANKDGGAHIDPKIPRKYENFKKLNLLNGFINMDLKEKTNSATLNSVRQIAFEVLYTLDKK